MVLAGFFGLGHRIDLPGFDACARLRTDFIPEAGRVLRQRPRTKLQLSYDSKQKVNSRSLLIMG